MMSRRSILRTMPQTAMRCHRISRWTAATNQVTTLAAVTMILQPEDRLRLRLPLRRRSIDWQGRTRRSDIRQPMYRR